jgi:hypothetical protein
MWWVISILINPDGTYVGVKMVPTLLQTRLQMAQLFEFGEFQQGKEKVVD